MEKVYSDAYVNSSSGVVMERANKQFKSKYPEYYLNLDYNSEISDANVIAIEKIFGIKVPKYIEDMKKQDMTDKYHNVRTRYLVNSIRDKVAEEREEFERSGKESALKNKVQSIGKHMFHMSKQAKSQRV